MGGRLHLRSVSPGGRLAPTRARSAPAGPRASRTGPGSRWAHSPGVAQAPARAPAGGPSGQRGHGARPCRRSADHLLGYWRPDTLNRSTVTGHGPDSGAEPSSPTASTGMRRTCSDGSSPSEAPVEEKARGVRREDYSAKGHSPAIATLLVQDGWDVHEGAPSCPPMHARRSPAAGRDDAPKSDASPRRPRTVPPHRVDAGADGRYEMVSRDRKPQVTGHVTWGFTEPPVGFEPTTYALQVRCSGQLS